MNKWFTKVAWLSLGLTLAVGVGAFAFKGVAQAVKADGPTQILSWTKSSQTSGFTFGVDADSRSGYYQDGGSAGDTRYLEMYRSTPLLSEAPKSITVTANLGGGEAPHALGNSVYACFVDASGDDVADSAVVLTSSITAQTGSDFQANLSIAKATSAYGVKIYHVKESGYNVRYYAFSLAYVASENPVEEVIEAINNIGEVTLTEACKAKIDAARTAYDLLTAEQKALVTNYSTLTAAEAAYSALEVDNVISLINAIGTVEYTPECKAKIDAASAAYDALSTEQKAEVTNYAVLTKAIADYNALTPIEASYVFKDVELGYNDNAYGGTWTSTKVVNSFESASPSRGVQFSAVGTGTLTLDSGSNVKFDGYDVVKVAMVVSTNGDADKNSLAVSVGSTAFEVEGTEDTSYSMPKANNYEVVFEGKAAGNVVVSYNDAHKSVYFKSITLTLEEQPYVAVRFAKDLLNLTDAVCEGYDGVSDNSAALHSVWETLVNSEHYVRLSDESKADLVNASAVEHATPVTDQDYIESAMARYEYLVAKYGANKYGDNKLTDFIGRNVEINNRVISIFSIDSNNSNVTSIVIVVTVSLVSLTAIGSFFFLKKRREQN